MNSPTTALIRDIWQRNRVAVLSLIGTMTLVTVMNVLTPASVRAAETDHLAKGIPLLLGVINMCATVAVFLLLFAIFGYTEDDTESKARESFPRRLFVLPVSTVRLVGIPTVLGVVSIELVYWTRVALTASAGVGYAGGFGHETVLPGVLLGTYMVVYQSFLWTLGSRLGALRLVVLGIVACVFLAVSSGATFPQAAYSAGFLSLFFTGVAIAALLAAWLSVRRRRSGGGEMDLPGFVPGNISLGISAVVAPYLAYRIGSQGLSRRPLGALIQVTVFASAIGILIKAALLYLSERRPKTIKPFQSALAAQFWFEWRRAGLVMPVLVAGLLCGFIGPCSWYFRGQPDGTLRILLTTLVMPIVLASMVGKAFSKPDFWASDLSIPTVVATRPLTESDLVGIKVRVAAFSAALSWLLILIFFSLWLPFWANPAVVAILKTVLVRAYGASLLSQLVTLSVVVLGFLLTWRFLVISLWLGLSGANKIFGLTAVPYVMVPIIAGIAFLVLRPSTPILASFLQFLSDWHAEIFSTVTLILVLKLLSAVFSLKSLEPRIMRHCIFYWLACSSILVLTALAVFHGLQRFPMVDTRFISITLIMASLLVVPLGRLSMAPLSLAKNRHR